MCGITTSSMAWGFGIIVSLFLKGAAGWAELPMAYLKRQYERSSILALAETDHQAVGAWQLLELLLRDPAVRSDRRLRYIVIERSQEVSDLYREIGFRNLSREQAAQLLPDTFGSSQYYFCEDFPSTPYVQHRVAETVRQTNASRTAETYLELVAIDALGMNSELRGDRDPIHRTSRTNCEANIPSRFGVSHNRERETAQNFREKILSRLQPGEKAIVLYHATHLFRRGEVCRPQHNGAFWEYTMGPASWWSMVLSEIRGITTTVVVDQEFQLPAPRSPFSAVVLPEDRRYRFVVDLERSDVPERVRRIPFSQFMNTGSPFQNPEEFIYGQFDGVIWWGSASGRWSAPSSNRNSWCSWEI